VARPVVIYADWDPEAGVWVASTPDINGLVTEADTIEALRAKLPGMIIDLLEETGIADLPATIEIIARASDRLDRKVKSKFTANGILKSAGLPRAF
jgi:predicted RNase H-like HicB family nuclease